MDAWSRRPSPSPWRVRRGSYAPAVTVGQRPTLRSLLHLFEYFSHAYYVRYNERSRESNFVRHSFEHRAMPFQDVRDMFYRGMFYGIKLLKTHFNKYTVVYTCV